MPKKIVTNISYTYGSITGNVNSISIRTGTVPDSEDYNKLKKQISGLENKIEILEGQVSSLKKFIQEYAHMMETLTNASIHDVSDMIEASERRIANIIQ